MAKKEAVEEVKENLPVNWQDEMAKYAGEVAKIFTAPVQPVSTRSGVLTINGAAQPENKVECIIVASVFENSYFGSAYDPDNIQPPACYAHSPNKTSGMIPAANVPNPVSASCQGCPNMEWGSAPGSSKGKACKEKVKIAFIPAGVKPEEVETAEVALLSIPVTSVRNFNKHVSIAAATTQRPPWGVITEISLTPDPKSQFKVNFDIKGLIEEPMFQPVHGLTNRAQELLLQPYDYSSQGPAEEVDTSKIS